MSETQDQQPQVEVTEESYLRWLRARQPPFEFFLGLAPEEQEILARIGDMYERDRCVGVGRAVRDPDTSALASRAAAGDKAAEESLLQRVARAAAQQEPQQRRGPAPLTMGGISERARLRAIAAHEARARSRSMLGRRPDPLEGLGS